MPKFVRTSLGKKNYSLLEISCDGEGD